MADFKKNRTPQEDFLLSAFQTTISEHIGRSARALSGSGMDPERAFEQLIIETIGAAAVSFFGTAFAAGKPADRDLFLLMCAQMFDEAADRDKRLNLKRKDRANG